jgi:hypothetical protein
VNTLYAVFNSPTFQPLVSLCHCFLNSHVVLVSVPILLPAGLNSVFISESNM